MLFGSPGSQPGADVTVPTSAFHVSGALTNLKTGAAAAVETPTASEAATAANATPCLTLRRPPPAARSLAV
jgi:hypothetical protein